MEKQGADSGAHDQREQIQERLIADLKEGKFVLYFQSIAAVAQPVVKVPSFRQILVRFKDEEDGLMPPGTFIPMLEQYGLMPVLDRWVMQQVVRWIAEKQVAAAPGPAPRCSLNLSVDTIRRDPAFIDYAVRRVTKGGIRSGSLSFDISMSEAMTQAKSLAAMIEPLRVAGCGFGLSGFTGEAPAFDLAELLGITFAKIDGSLMYGISRNPEARARVEAIHRRCHEVGMQTICAQVEDAESLEILRLIPVDYAQGFGIDRPRALD